MDGAYAPLVSAAGIEPARSTSTLIWPTGIAPGSVAACPFYGLGHMKNQQKKKGDRLGSGWREGRDSNPWPAALQAAALPLSYQPV